MEGNSAHGDVFSYGTGAGDLEELPQQTRTLALLAAVRTGMALRELQFIILWSTYSGFTTIQRKVPFSVLYLIDMYLHPFNPRHS